MAKTQSHKLPLAEWKASIPEALRKLDRWCGYASVADKAPRNLRTGELARTNDPSTWGSFKSACYWRDTHPNGGAGIVTGDGIGAVDFDKARNEDGPLPWSASRVEALAAVTNVEVSPSGRGYHAFVSGVDGMVEFKEGLEPKFCRHQFVTVTGLRLDDAKAEVGPVPADLAPLFAPRAANDTMDTVPQAAEPERYEEIAAALAYLNPDMPRPEWLKVGMALKAGLGEAGRSLWVGWSKDGSKHVSGEPDRLWAGFNKSGVGLGSIVWMAEQAGWTRDGKYTRPEDVFTVIEAPAAEPEAQAARSPLVLVTASRVKRVPVHWLWKFRIARGHLAVIAGDPKVGKTLMVEALAVLRSRGKPLPGDTACDPPRRWVLLESEDDEGDTTTPRLFENGADMDYVTILDRAESAFSVTDPAHLEILERQVRALGDVEAVVVSPLNNFLGNTKLDMNKDEDIRRVLMPLVALAKRLGVAVIVIKHLNKGTSSNALYKVNGSIGAVGVARTVLLVGKRDDQRYVAVAGSNSKDAPALAFDIESSPNDENIGVLTWGEATEGVDAKDLIAQPTPDKGEGAVAWLVHRLSAGPVPAADVYEEGRAAGYSEATLKRARPKAGAVSVPRPSNPDGTKAGNEWRLAQAGDVQRASLAGRAPGLEA